MRWLSRDEERAWRGYRRMHTLLDLQIGRDLFSDSALSDADYDVLSTLTESRDKSWRASELAKHLSWSTSRLAHHVGRMERRGLVRRDNCVEDGRGATIVLADAGWAVLQEAAPRHVASVRRNFIDLLTPSELQSLVIISEKVINQLVDPVQPKPIARTMRDDVDPLSR